MTRKYQKAFDRLFETYGIIIGVTVSLIIHMGLLIGIYPIFGTTDIGSNRSQSIYFTFENAEKIRKVINDHPPYLISKTEAPLALKEDDIRKTDDQIVSKSQAESVAGGVEDDKGEGSLEGIIYSPDFLSYWNIIKQKIRKNQFYPDRAKNMWIKGSVFVQITILKDGSLKEIKVQGSSGSQLLDDAVLTAINRATPFPPFPPVLNWREKITLAGIELEYDLTFN